MGLHRLSKLELKSNFLTDPPPLTFIRSSLVFLDLSWNQITHIPRSYFYRCQKLNTIMVTKNKLSEVPNVELIAGLLQHIGMTGNDIVDAVPFYGKKYPRLTHIYFDKNNLDKFCMPTGTSVLRLRALRLHSNNLTTLQLPADYHDTHITLYDNPWHCDGALGWARECTPEGRDLACPRYVNLGVGFTCYSPVNMRGMSPHVIGMECFRSSPHD